MYVKTPSDGKTFIIAVHVDDILLGGKHSEQLDDRYANPRQAVQHDLGELTYFFWNGELQANPHSS